MNLLRESVSNTLRQARPAAVHGLMLTSLVAFTLALSGCGGGGAAVSPPAQGGSSGVPGDASGSGPTGTGSGTTDGGSTGGGTSGGTGGGPVTGPATDSGSPVTTPTPVVYLATQQDIEKYELFVTDSKLAGESVKLSGPLATDANVNEFTVTQSGAAVVYTADQTTVNRTEV